MYRTCLGAGQTQLALGFFSRKQEHLFLGFSLKAIVCLMSQSHPALRFEVAGAALGSEDVCPVSRAGGFAVMQVCSPPDRVGDSEYHQSLPADLC